MLVSQIWIVPSSPCCFFFFKDTAPPEIYPLSLHDPLPISSGVRPSLYQMTTRRTDIPVPAIRGRPPQMPGVRDRKSTRLNSSHLVISYAVFCLKKKNQNNQNHNRLYHSHYSIFVDLMYA